MQNEWPTQVEDLAAAADIIEKHEQENGGAPLQLFELLIEPEKENPFEVKILDWVKELVIHFKIKYGDEQGALIANKVLTRYLLRHETLH
ncbi:MAG: hypothetical protein HWD59_04235 [Coxiellaceae bacterium]|nr:MAG: hypothetical protein HWD59_04235 [Coxiellaceae bacterium]